MTKVYVILDENLYEPSELIAVYSDKEKAKKWIEKQHTEKRSWLYKQEELEEIDPENAWSSNPPNRYCELNLYEMEIIK